MIKTISKNRFKTLGKALDNVGINIEYQIDWGTSFEGDYKHSDQPRIGSGTYNGIEGWYFRKSDNINFTPKQKKQIKDTLLRKGFKCKSIDDYEEEWDGDRSYPPSINFIDNK